MSDKTTEPNLTAIDLVRELNYARAEARYQQERAQALWEVVAGRNDAVERAMKERDDARAMLNLAVTCAVDAALGEVRRQGGPDYLLREARSEGIMAARVYGYGR